MFGKPRPSEIAAQIKTEYSPNSPAMRLTLVNYVLTNDGDISTLDELLEFVSGGYEDFIEELESTFVDEPETTELEVVSEDDAPWGGYA